MCDEYLSDTGTLPGQRQETERGGGDPLLRGPGRASEPDRPNPAQRTETPNPLQLKEMDEINNWMRLGAQLYFGWFTLMLTVNGLAVGWIFTHNGALPPFTPLLFGVFIVLDLMATVASYRIRNHMLSCDRRLIAILEEMARHRVAADPHVEVLSPMPREAVRTVFLFTGGVMFLLLLFWIIITAWGMAMNFSRVVAG